MSPAKKKFKVQKSETAQFKLLQNEIILQQIKEARVRQIDSNKLELEKEQMAD